MPRHDFKYDKDLKGTPEFQSLYNKWQWIRKRKYSQEFEVFMDFYHWSLSNGFVIGAILKRLDNSKPWSPGNCVWEKPAEQPPAYTEKQKAWIAKWNKTVNILRRHFNIETFDYEGD